MRILSPEECAAFAEKLVTLDDRRVPMRDTGKPHRLRSQVPSAFTKSLWLSRFIESRLDPRDECLIWVTAWNIFPSNENFHLFYRLRETYGERRLLHEAPGHLCLNYESAEVVTLVQLGILFGWDLHLITTDGYARAFISHDEWFELGFDHEEDARATAEDLRGADLVVSNPS
jgi:hypothetical protein